MKFLYGKKVLTNVFLACFLNYRIEVMYANLENLGTCCKVAINISEECFNFLRKHCETINLKALITELYFKEKNEHILKVAKEITDLLDN